MEGRGSEVYKWNKPGYKLHVQFEWIGTVGNWKDSDGKFPSFLQHLPRVCQVGHTIDRCISLLGGKHQYVKCKRHSKRVPGPVIGASLSEPHTSVTALLDVCVCMYVCFRVAIYRKF